MNRLCARVLRKALRRADLGSWRLPFEYYMHVLDGTREPELEHLGKICPRGGVAIDIGANHGYYTFEMARQFNCVYAFEANRQVSTPIRTSSLQNVHLVDKGLSNTDRDAVLHIPVVGGIALSGWASLETGICPDATGYVERAVELTTLDAFSIECVDLIKIDVEGHELEVLEGARRTIATSMPMLIVEIKDDNYDRVADLVAGYGYDVSRLIDVIGVPGSAENYILRPGP
jgi:FkbM family methyltransferase